jgi:hypothetical protein
MLTDSEVPTSGMGCCCNPAQCTSAPQLPLLPAAVLLLLLLVLLLKVLVVVHRALVEKHPAVHLCFT